MNYFKKLNLKREPFSNAPDPELFYKTKQHNSCLQQLEIAIRLKRGLNVIIGEVGTGKTTLSRHLIRSVSEDKNIKSNLILDPAYSDALSFLKALRDQMCPHREQDSQEDELSLKEQIKSYLFDQVAVNRKTELLIIDEGQKIPNHCLEILRELLNFESNTEKLLQIIIFAQPELKGTLNSMPNVSDRINLYYEIGPLSFKDTQNLILHRIEKSKIEYNYSIKFSLPALWAIYRCTGGYPRKIINLCHKITLALVMHQKFKVTRSMVNKCNEELPNYVEISDVGHSKQPVYYIFASIVVLIALLFLLQNVNIIPEIGLMNLLSPFHVREMSLGQGYGNQTRNLESEKKDQKTSPHTNKTTSSDDPGGGIALLYSGSNPYSFDGIKAPNNNVFSLDSNEANNSPEKEIPCILGSIQVKDKENLWNLSKKIYGIQEPHLIKQIVLEQLVENNPHIEDRNLIQAQSEIKFPVILFNHHLAAKGYKLLFAETKTLKKAYSKLYELKNDLSKQLLCTWSSQKGFNFYILTQKTYRTKSEARTTLIPLPGKIRNQTKIFNLDEQNFAKQTYYLSKLEGLST